MSASSAGTGYGALDGVRVLDLSRVLAGPYCGQLLGDHGALVTKVEAPAGDDTRLWGTPLPEGSSSYYNSINRNKENICLDLRTDAGREIVWKLLETTDVLIENFKAGTMAKWGLDFARDLAPRFPRLIYCSISGYGNDGPLGGLPGYDAALQAYSGLMSVNGEAEREPMRIGVPVVDGVTGILAFSGILMALYEREHSGRGQAVECTLFDTSLSLLHPHSAHWLASGELPVRTGAAHPSIAPYETFATSRGLFFISAANDRQFGSLAEVLGAPGLAEDARFLTNADRLANIDELRDILRGLIQNRHPDELGAELLARGVAASPVQDVRQSLLSPQSRHRDMLIEVDGYISVGIPIKLDRTPGRVAKAPSLKNGDEAAVLTRLGVTAPTPR
jgi:crotonobetainyl-CoA:carnitine CoA-transferase CaiB-like acyl-CoA transferase